jgi:hypothetical protein
MKSIKSWMFAAALGLAAFGVTAQPVTVSGVRYDETADVKGAKIHLNGAGTRYKAIFKVYTAGLYLPKKSSVPEEVIAMQGAKRLSITMLRDIDSAELGKLFSRGMEDNMEKASFAKIVPSVIRMGELFAECKSLKAGESFIIDWVPGTGMLLSINSAKCFKNLDPFKEKEFYDALLRIWLGHAPADYKLKDALLGKAS